MGGHLFLSFWFDIFGSSAETMFPTAPSGGGGGNNDRSTQGFNARKVISEV